MLEERSGLKGKQAVEEKRIAPGWHVLDVPMTRRCPEITPEPALSRMSDDKWGVKDGAVCVTDSVSICANMCLLIHLLPYL